MMEYVAESVTYMDGTRASILIAQADNESSLATHLVREGYQVEHVYYAGPFLTDFSHMKPDLVVLDSSLPGGDAFALCGRVREQGDTAILMLIHNDDESVERAFRMGATDVLYKPISVTIFCHRVESVLELQQQQKQMQAYERRWQQMFERNRGIQLIVNPQNGQIVDANPAACAFYGYTREEFQRKLIIDLDVPNPSNNGDVTLFNFKHRTATGKVRDVKIFSNPLEYEGKTLLYLAISDMTKLGHDETHNSDRRVLAEALRNTASALSNTLDQDEALDQILQQVNMVVPSECANIMLIEAGIARVARGRGYESQRNHLTIDSLRFKVDDTPTLRWMVEKNRPLVVGSTREYDDWTHLASEHEWLQSYAAAPIRLGNYVIGFLNADSSTPNRFTRLDAEHLQIFADQAAIAIRNTRLYDQVRRQSSEMERRVVSRTADLESERGQMRSLVDAMTEGVAHIEYSEGKYRARYVNKALEQMTGYPPDDWKTQSVNLFRPKGMTDDQYRDLLKTATAELSSKGYWRNDARLARKDGTEFDAVIVSSRVEGKDKATLGWVTVVRDISKEKALQQQKERFVAYASHELRTPITNLKTRLYLMRRQPERMDEHMRVLEAVTDRMKRLVEDLLDISRFERGVINLVFKDVVLQEMLSNLVMIQQPEAERKGLELTCDLPGEPVHVDADIERLAQVITNLLTNAINYTPSGGHVKVRLSHVHDVTGELALVEVQDTGIGIAEEHLSNIFQPFYRVVSQVEGSGLGLSITKEIIELHGGEIDVASQVGSGSTFCFWLPLLTPPKP